MKTMKRSLAWLALLPIAAMAQEMDHSKMSMPMDMPMPAQEKPAVEKPAAEKSAAPKKKATPAAPEGHADHPAQAAPAPAVDHSKMNHAMPMPGMDHSAMGHDMGSMPQHSMDGMVMSPATTEPRTPIPALTDADRAAAVPPEMVHASGDNDIHSYTLLNRLEAWDADPGTGMAWEGEGWIGTDLNRLWWRSEGERVDGTTEAADVELLYGYSIATWWDVVAGLRQDFKPGDSQTFAAIGVQGLAPQNFEVQATAYVGERGQTAARFEADYELLFTNRLILQPRLEVNAYGKNDPARGIGSGISTVEAGLRLRYEFTRQFAPYLGVAYERAFGNTADLRRNAGEDLDDVRLLAGLRIWF
jgi:copper resistance protein B